MRPGTKVKILHEDLGEAYPALAGTVTEWNPATVAGYVEIHDGACKGMKFPFSQHPNRYVVHEDSYAHTLIPEEV